MGAFRGLKLWTENQLSLSSGTSGFRVVSGFAGFTICGHHSEPHPTPPSKKKNRNKLTNQRAAGWFRNPIPIVRNVTIIRCPLTFFSSSKRFVCTKESGLARLVWLGVVGIPPILLNPLVAVVGLDALESAQGFTLITSFKLVVLSLPVTCVAFEGLVVASTKSPRV